VTALVSLSLGIGANTAIFSLVNAVMLRREPLLHPEEIVDVIMTRPEAPYSAVSYPDFLDLRNGTRDVFVEMAASRITFVPADREGGIDVLPAEMVSGNYFSLLGVQARMGRTLLPEDDVSPGAHPVAVLGYGYWMSAFGGDENVLGRHIRLTGRLYTIVGVAPKSYRGMLRGLAPAFYLPILMINEINDSNELEQRGNQSSFVKARLRHGVTVEHAQVSVTNVVSSLRSAHPSEWHADADITLIPTQDVILWPSIDSFVRAAAWLLLAAVGLVLLLVCANLANLLLARAVDRRKEIAVRLALGATPRALVAQLFTETALLGVFGALAGVALGIWSLKFLLVADLPLPGFIDISLDVGLDPRVLAFCIAVSIGAVLLFGLLPAVQLARPDVVSTLKRDTSSGFAPGRGSLRKALVVLQVAISTALLIGASLLVRSFLATQSVDPGFGRDPAAILSMALPSTRYSEKQGRAFLRDLLDRFERIPGVESVGLTGLLHLETVSRQSMRVNVDGVEPPSGRQDHSIAYAEVDAGFFDATGIRVLSGRVFSEFDRSDTPPVAIISEAMERKFWPGRSALGQMLHESGGQDLQVVGIASDTKVHSLGERPQPFIYRPFSQDYSSTVTVVAKTSLAPKRTALEMMAIARELDPEIWLWKVETLERHLGIILLPARLSALVFCLFAALAVALASVGLYGSVSYAVSQRTREMGIRMSLGADRAVVVRSLVGMGMRLAGVGGTIGFGVALLLVRPLSRLLFATSPFDSVTLTAVPLFLGVVALVAAYLPARRASTIDPVSALRSE